MAFVGMSKSCKVASREFVLEEVVQRYSERSVVSGQIGTADSLSQAHAVVQCLNYANQSRPAVNIVIVVQAFLGQGSFGYVVMVKKREKPMQGRRFALKSLSKHAVVDGKQVDHVLDEKAVRKLTLLSGVAQGAHEVGIWLQDQGPNNALSM